MFQTYPQLSWVDRVRVSIHLLFIRAENRVPRHWRSLAPWFRIGLKWFGYFGLSCLCKQWIGGDLLQVAFAEEPDLGLPDLNELPPETEHPPDGFRKCDRLMERSQNWGMEKPHNGGPRRRGPMNESRGPHEVFKTQAPQVINPQEDGENDIFIR